MKVLKRLFKTEKTEIPEIKGSKEGKLYYNGNFFKIPKVKEMIKQLSESNLRKSIDEFI